MYNKNAYSAYRNNAVNTASKGNLLLMLYDGAIKFLRFATIAIDDKNIQKANEYLIKTQDIISELMITLNFDVGGDIAKNLFSLYEYMNNELVEANISKDKEKIITIKVMLEDLRNTWAKIA